MNCARVVNPGHGESLIVVGETDSMDCAGTTVPVPTDMTVAETVGVPLGEGTMVAVPTDEGDVVGVPVAPGSTVCEDMPCTEASPDAPPAAALPPPVEVEGAFAPEEVNGVRLTKTAPRDART